MKTINETLAKKETEIVTNIETDSWGRTWGTIGTVRVLLTYAIDANGTWLDLEGNYHFNARSN